MILQKIYQDNPWRMLVCCILLNRTSRAQVDGVRDLLFLQWPTPEDMAFANENELTQVLRPLGLYNKRSSVLKKMSLEWLEGFDDVSELTGVGAYAVASWKIFQEGDTSVETDDKELLSYLDSIGEKR